MKPIYVVNLCVALLFAIPVVSGSLYAFFDTKSNFRLDTERHVNTPEMAESTGLPTVITKIASCNNTNLFAVGADGQIYLINSNLTSTHVSKLAGLENEFVVEISCSSYCESNYDLTKRLADPSGALSYTALALTASGQVYAWGVDVGNLGINQGAGITYMGDFLLDRNFTTFELHLQPVRLEPPLPGLVATGIYMGGCTAAISYEDSTTVFFGECGSWCFLPNQQWTPPGGLQADLSITGPVRHLDVRSKRMLLCSTSGKVYAAGKMGSWQPFATTETEISVPYEVPLPPGSSCKSVHHYVSGAMVVLMNGTILHGSATMSDWVLPYGATSLSLEIRPSYDNLFLTSVSTNLQTKDYRVDLFAYSSQFGPVFLLDAPPLSKTPLISYAEIEVELLASIILQCVLDRSGKLSFKWDDPTASVLAGTQYSVNFGVSVKPREFCGQVGDTFIDDENRLFSCNYTYSTVKCWEQFPGSQLAFESCPSNFLITTDGKTLLQAHNEITLACHGNPLIFPLLETPELSPVFEGVSVRKIAPARGQTLFVLERNGTIAELGCGLLSEQLVATPTTFNFGLPPNVAIVDFETIENEVEFVNLSVLMVDNTSRLWSWGDNSVGQLCFPPSTDNWNKPARLVDYAWGGKIDKIVRFQRSFLIKTDAGGLFSCGVTLIAPGGGGGQVQPIPLDHISGGAKLMKISAGTGYYAGVMLFFENRQLWMFFGGVWISKSAELDAVGFPRVSDLLNRFYVTELEFNTSSRYIFPSSQIFKIDGYGFGRLEDGQPTNITLWISSSSESRDCYVISRSASTIDCQISSGFSSGFARLPVLANVTIGTNMAESIQLGIFSEQPVLSDSVDQLIAENANELVLYGEHMDFASTVVLSSGTCSIVEQAPDHLRCALSGVALAKDSFLRASISVSGQISSLLFLPVARIVARPVIQSSSSLIVAGTTLFSIYGQGFNPVNASVSNRVWLRLGDGNLTECAAQAANATATYLECVIADSAILSAQSGTVYAVVRSYNGLSEQKAIGVLGTTSAIAGDNSVVVGGFVGTLVILFIIAMAIIIFFFWRRMRKMKSDIKGSVLNVPREMASMFNIKSSELRIVSKLGEGSFGAVFKAQWQDKVVAVKKMTASMMSSHVNDFFREATTMTSIPPHKNVIRIYGLCQEQNNFSLIMEFAQNGSLESLAAQQATSGWEPAQLWTISYGIASGMAHLASNNLVHRDLAARNILLGDAFEPKVSDFGMSRVVSDNSGQTKNDVGPVKWMPPESIQDMKYSEKSDVWSFGVLLYELVLGHQPYMGESLLEVAVRVRDQDWNAYKSLRPEEKSQFPPYFLELMQWCFRHEDSTRPTFAQIVEFLGGHKPAGGNSPRHAVEQGESKKSKSKRFTKQTKKDLWAEDEQLVEMN